MDVLNNIGFDWQVALANFVSFLIIFAILKRWVFGPVQTVLEKRKATINEGVQQAQDSQELLAEAQRKSDSLIKEAKQEANQIVAQAKHKSDDMVEEAKTTAQQEAQKVSEKEALKREQERKDMEREFSQQSAALVVQAVTKILEDEVDEGTDKRITKKALEELNAQSHHA